MKLVLLSQAKTKERRDENENRQKEFWMPKLTGTPRNDFHFSNF